MLYQVSERFSERLAATPSDQKYTDIIVVWDAVLNRLALQHAVKEITTAIHTLRSPAKSTPLKITSSPIEPRKITKANLEKFSDVGTKTFTATTDILLNFLDDENDRRDYPIKVTEEEHDIIMLQSDKPILVLGRSGTGKTTICLNRLWLNFRNHKQLMTDSKPLDISPKHKKVTTQAISIEEVPIIIYNQVFITKNHALCAKMKKRFYDFVAGCQHTTKYLPHENQNLPEKLTEVQHFPLFVTAKQFFTMLDKSLGCEDERFFKPGVRVESSSNQADTHSLNLLFEIAQDDDEEDDRHNNQAQIEKASPPMKEITADEFITDVWPQISKYCDKSKTDPLLVWTEIESFIEGSRQSLESEDGFLSVNDYCSIGQKQAPRVLTRENVYELFEQYRKKICHKDITKNRFTNGKLIWHLNKRLKKIEYRVPWSIHELYVDEVQDFTQAELFVILKCCQDPNRSFFAGDTAQTVMKGIFFRFEELKSLFHSLKEAGTKCEVPEVHELTKNYRSHSSITDMASSVTELLQQYFPDTFDKLPPDESNIIGPKPLFICSKDLLDNFLLKQSIGNTISIEFGADQVIIARDSSEEGRKKMPTYLQDEIILNVQECKGLEFNDVLLYNFFTDTPKQIQEMWRISATYLEDHPEKKISEEEAQFGVRPPLEFDERCHKSLCAELKILYTIVTRARCHVWVYEDTSLEHLPMIKYWQIRNLITIVSRDDTEIPKNFQQEKSSTTDWKKQGDMYMEKRLWYAAKKCYQKAKENSLENIAHARALEQKALRTKQTDVGQFRNVAALFIKCSVLEPQKEHVKNAAICLFRAKMYEEALKLFEMIDEHKYAIHICKAHMTRDMDTLVRLYEKSGKYKLAIKLLLQKKKYDLAIDVALKHPDVDCYNLVKDLLYGRIKTAIRTNHKQDLLKLVRAVPKLSEQVHYLKEAKMYSEACDFLQEKREYRSTFRICRAQHLYTKGIEIAEQAAPSHADTKHSLILLQAEHHIITEPTLVDKRNELKKLLDTKVLTDHHEARACLLLAEIILRSNGNPKQTIDLCIKAHNIYKRICSSVGEIEALHTLNQVREKRNEYTLEHCKLIVDIMMILNQLCDLLNKPIAPFTRDVNEAEKFYGLEKYGSDYYYVSKQVDLFFHMQRKSEIIDSDGMIRLEKTETLRRLIQHYQKYESKFRSYLGHFRDSWHKKLIQPFSFHSELLKKPFYLQKSCRLYPVEEITRYLKILDTVLYIHTKHPTIHIGDDIIEYINRILSPFSQLCLNFREKNFQYLAQESQAFKDVLCQRAFDELKEMICNTHKTPNIDKWLQAWRLIQISGEDKVHQLNLLIDEQVTNVNQQSQTLANFEQDPVRHPSLAYVQTDMGSYQNIFVMWERTCTSYRENGDILMATKNSLTHFIEVIVKQKHLHMTLSLENLINILTIQCSALLGLISACQGAQIIIPETFEHMIKTFDFFNCLGQQNTLKGLMATCANQDITSDLHDCTRLLISIVKIMVGICDEDYCPLQKAVSQGTDTEIVHCLVLILTIIGNLVALNPQNTEIQPIMKIIIKVLRNYASQRVVVSKIYSNLTTVENTKDLFTKVIQSLLKVPELQLLKVMQTSTSLEKKKISIKLIFSSRLPSIGFHWKTGPENSEIGVSSEISPQGTIESTPLTSSITVIGKTTTETVQNTKKSEHGSITEQSNEDKMAGENEKKDDEVYTEQIVDSPVLEATGEHGSISEQSKEDKMAGENEKKYDEVYTKHIVDSPVVEQKKIDQEKMEFLHGDCCIACNQTANEGHFSSPKHIAKKKLYRTYEGAAISYKITQDHLKEIIDECRQADTTEDYELEQKVQEAEQLIEDNNQRINKMYEENNEWRQSTEKFREMRDKTSKIIHSLQLHKKCERIQKEESDNVNDKIHESDETESDEEGGINIELKKAKLTSSSKRTTHTAN